MKKTIGMVAMLCMSLLMSSNLTNEQVPQEKQSVKAKLDAKIYHYQNNQSRDNALFFSEYAEGSSNNKYLEIYNPTGADVDLSGYALANVSNAPSEVGVHEYWISFAEGAVIAAGDVYVVCHPSSDDYILNECDQTHSYMSNGDDGYALAAGSEDSYVYIDWVGDFNGDPGSAWDVCGGGDTKDNTLLRSADVCSGNEWSVSSNVDSCEWTVLDNNTWDYLGSHDGSACEAAACPDGTVDDCSGDGDCAPSSWIGDGWCDGEDQPFGYDLTCYDNDGSDCGQTCADQGLVDDCDDSGECAPGSWIGDGWCDGEDQAFGYDLSCYECDGGDCADECGECDGDNSTCTDDCGVVNGDNSTCSSAVTFSVDMNLEGVTGDVKVRTSTVNGDYNPSDWFVMDDSDGDMVYTYTMSLVDGVTYGYNFNDGSYESGDGLGDCAGGNYGNDRYVTPEGDTTLDTVCWESCEACATVIPGCTDDEALNFDENATEDDGSCYYEYAEAANLFFSECAEGSSNNKYLEIYNASGAEVDMSGYSLSSCSNGCNEADVWDYADNVTFDAGTMVAADDVFVVCHGSADDYIQAECDATFTYLSNGDDVFAITQIGSGVVLDIIGTTGDDPGSGWEVAGVSNATKDHTIVRKSSVEGGTTDWAMSAGTTADDSEWVVFDQNTWDYLGSHPHEFVVDVEGCMDANATNYDPAATVQSYNEFYTSTCTYANCADIPTEMGCLWEDGTSSEWWEGWWNCTDAGAQVCGLHEVVFELNLPEGISGTPHVNGSYNGWCGSCYNAMGDDDGDGTWTHVQYFGSGETHDYKFTTDGWSNQEDLTGLDCAVLTDGYWNRQFTTGDANTSQTQTFCWGTCEATCEGVVSCEDQGLVTCEDGTCADTADDCYPDPEMGIMFTGAFGGALNDGYTYTTPGGAEAWAGFANENTSIYPLTFTDGGTLTLTGSNETDTDIEVYFRFEYNPYPDTEPSFNTESLFITGGEEEYSLSIPSQGDNTYSSFLLYVVTRDVPVTLTNVTLTGSGDGGADDGGTGCAEGTVDDCSGDGDCAPASWIGDGWCDGTDQPFGADLTCYDNDGGDCLVTSMVTFDVDGVGDCGFVSVTGTFDGWSGWGANTDTGMMAEIPNGDHEYVILCVNAVDGWWYDIWANSTIFNAPIDGSCWNGNYDYPNYTLSVEGDMTVSVCAGSCDETCAPAYDASDVNADGATNVQDVVSIVSCILETAGVCEFTGGNGDVNGDGFVNVQDVVAIVGTILGGRTTSDATDAKLNINDGFVSLKANGFIGAVQMTLSHDAGFAINLTDKAMVADYRTNGNSTTLIVIAPEGDYLFDATGEFTFEEVMVYNSEDEVSTSIVPNQLALSKAYPNPFNPSTSLSIALPADGFVSISVYNVMGQQVDVLHSGNMTAGTHNLTWNASNMTSGMYFVRAESADGVSTQKVMLMK